jgi:hypothetical protein
MFCNVIWRLGEKSSMSTARATLGSKLNMLQDSAHIV